MAVHFHKVSCGCNCPFEDVGLSHKLGCVEGLGLEVDLLGCAGALYVPAAEYRDAVGDGHGLLLVVGDIYGGKVILTVGLQNLCLERSLELLVCGAQGLVQEEQSRVHCYSPCQGNPLFLAAREGIRLPLSVSCKLNCLQKRLGPGLDLILIPVPGLGAVAYVLLHIHVGK